MPIYIEEKIYRMDPKYALGYEEGYNACKKEMRELLRKLEAYKEVPTTI